MLNLHIPHTELFVCLFDRFFFFFKPTIMQKNTEKTLFGTVAVQNVWDKTPSCHW